MMADPLTKPIGRDMYKSNDVTMRLCLMFNVSWFNHLSHNDWTITFMMAYIIKRHITYM